MTPTLARAQRLTDAQLRALSPKKRRALEHEVAAFIRRDSQVNQLVYYRVANPDAMKLHRSVAREFGIQGGNKSAKSGTMLAEAAIQMTGVVPLSLAVCRACRQPMSQTADGRWGHATGPERPSDDGHAPALLYPVSKLRSPIRVRLVVTSNVNAWDENLKQKLQYSQWNGRLNEHDLAGDPRYGHWGWIPQRFLIHGDWEASWSERHRKLTLNARGDGGTEPGSTLTVMSHQQAEEDFNQGSYHLVIEDEIPPEPIHRANRIRTLEVRGQVITGGTPPDDRPGAVSAAWFFDQVLTPGFAGANPERVEAVALWTEHNRTLEPAAVEEIAQGLTPDEKRARFHGDSLHLAGLIIRGFTEKARLWCFACNAALMLGLETCPACGSRDLAPYRHVWDEEDLAWPGPREWPTLFYMDPHQAKPTACLWVRLDPNDAGWVVAEKEIEGDAATVKAECESFEREHGLHPVFRKGDPKITAQTNQFAREFQGQPFNIRRAFEEVGFYFEDANTNFAVGIERLERLLRPTPLTRAPGLRIYRGCPKTIYQVGRFCFDEATELLTPDGWMAIASIGSRMVATLATGLSGGPLSFAFEKPSEYVEHKYSGPMIRFESRNLDLLVTPNHRMLVRYPEQRPGFRVCAASKMRTQYSMPIAAPAAPRPSVWASPLDLMIGEEDWAEFLGWYIAEGYCLKYRRPNGHQDPRIGISQTPGVKADRIAALLRRLPWEHRYAGTDFTIHNEPLWRYLQQFGAAAPEKRLPREIFAMASAGQQRCLEALIDGDGHRVSGRERYDTTSRGLADDVTELMAHLGRASSVTMTGPKPPRVLNGRLVTPRCDSYRVTARVSTRVSTSSADGTPYFRPVDYAGIVRCVTVPNGTLLARRNGQQIFTGNTWERDKPGRTHSDFPAALRYFAIDDSSYRGLALVRTGTPAAVGAGREGRNRRTGW